MQPPATNPSSFPRRLLLAVTGMSPQVVTESVYALAVARRPAFVPTEVALVTTAEGAREAELNLLSDRPGWFSRLVGDFDLAPIRFDSACIHVVTDSTGAPLADIRSPDDNRRAADLIARLVRDATSDPECALHLSIAGGRKTMGYYAGSALSLFGRAQDRLSHVLVDEPFESIRDFYYPSPESRVVAARDGRTVDASTARVTLAEIPFVRLRHHLPPEAAIGALRFDDAVRAVDAAVAPPRLALVTGSRSVAFGARHTTLPPAQFALLAVIADRTRHGAPPVSAPLKHPQDVDREWSDEFLADLSRTCGRPGWHEAVAERLRRGVDEAWFSQTLSRLRRTLRETLQGIPLRELIDAGPTRPRRYRIALPPEAIELRRGEEATSA
jgi:CRISPR-associated protein (TIGR02584 family)